jgi:GNAT superfamily N-acetyltransferase
MAWTVTGDVEEHVAHAGRFLHERAVENTVILTAIETLRARGTGAFGDTSPLFGWWRGPGGGVTAAFMHTPPYGAALTLAMPPAVASLLAETLAARGRQLPWVDADAAAADAFAQTWQARTGQVPRPGRRSRLHRLGRLRPPEPPPPGRPRVAGPADTGLLAAWLTAFHEEADPMSPPGHTRVIDDRLSYGGLTLWETADGPVSLGGLTRPVAGQVRVGPVYTPPPWRGRGFGGAVTAAVTSAALATGAHEVLLYTDLANPTSNALYARLGYTPVADRVMLLLGPPEP